MSEAAPRLRRPWVGGAIVAVVATLLPIAAFDLWLRRNPPGADRSYAPGYANHAALGRMPNGPGRFPSRSWTPDGETVYEVVYGIDEHGFRASPKGPPGTPTYLFFGGSFTYGEGVEDEETYPVRFAQALGEPVTVVNLGFHGYGPNQMLRALELGVPDAAITGPVRRAFYLALADHLDRAAGAYWWNLKSPRYELDEAGRPVFSGTFSSDPFLAVTGWLNKRGGLPELASRSLFAQRFPPDARVQKTAAIMAASARILAERYQTDLLVLLWDDAVAALLEPLAEALRRHGIATLRVSSLIGDLDQPAYRIRDGVENHPSPLAYEKLGSALAEAMSDGR